jgi:type IV pilus assembly protein PilZ
MQEQRKHRRVPLNVEVTCIGPNDLSFKVMARDISLGGMFLSLPDQASVLAFGTQLVVRVTLPGHPQELALPCTVRWSRPDGFGVQFGLLGARATHVITKLAH